MAGVQLGPAKELGLFLEDSRETLKDLKICTTETPLFPPPPFYRRETETQSTSLTYPRSHSPALGQTQTAINRGPHPRVEGWEREKTQNHGFQDFILKIKELSEQEKLICPIPLLCTPWVDPSCSFGLTLPTHQPLAKGEG